jgi:hypothetical protein
MQKIDILSMRDSVPVATDTLYDSVSVREQIRNEFKEGFADNWVVTPIGSKCHFEIEFDGGKFVSTKISQKSISEPIDFNGNVWMPL